MSARGFVPTFLSDGGCSEPKRVVKFVQPLDLYCQLVHLPGVHARYASSGKPCILTAPGRQFRCVRPGNVLVRQSRPNRCDSGLWTLRPSQTASPRRRRRPRTVADGASGCFAVQAHTVTGLGPFGSVKVWGRVYRPLTDLFHQAQNDVDS